VQLQQYLRNPLEILNLYVLRCRELNYIEQSLMQGFPLKLLVIPLLKMLHAHYKLLVRLVSEERRYHISITQQLFGNKADFKLLAVVCQGDRKRRPRQEPWQPYYALEKHIVHQPEVFVWFKLGSSFFRQAHNLRRKRVMARTVDS